MSSNVRESIKVICRMRPENQKEIDTGLKLCINKKSDTNLLIHIDSENKNPEVNEFSFDRVYSPDSTQEEVFEYCAVPIINGALSGYNGTVFCYGQTSSGKTFTMEGVPHDSKLKGIIPRMMEYIFTAISSFPSELEFSVKCSFLEIYLEKIQDLLDCTTILIIL